MKDLNSRTGRNDPCPCGSGGKYKKCCQDMTERILRSLPAERLKYVYLKLSSSLLCGYQNDDYLNKIKDLPLEKSIKLLSCLDGMLNDNLPMNKNFVEDCVKHLLSGLFLQKALYALKIGEAAFLHKMLLLNFFKLLVLRSSGGDTNTDETELNHIIGEILLELNNYPESVYHKKYKKKDIIPLNEIEQFLIREFMFNTADVFGIAILRYYIMCVELPDKLKSSRQYFNINEILKKNFEVSLLQYIAFVCGLNCMFSKSAFIDEDTCFSATQISQAQLSILYSLIRLNFEEYRQHLNSELNLSEDISFKVITVKNYPLIKMSDKTYCISRDYLHRKLSENLYWLLFDACKQEFNGNINKFTNFWGELFQEYITWLLENSEIKNCKFRLRVKKDRCQAQKNEIDLLIYDDNNIAIVEIKSSRLNKKTIETGDLASFKNDLKKTYQDCAVQMKSVLQSVCNDEYDLTPVVLKNIKNVFPVFLFLEPMPQGPIIYNFYQRALEEVDFPRADKIKEPIIMSSLEFEKMLFQIKNGRLFSLLSEKTSNYINREQSVKNFLFNKKADVELPGNIKSKLDEINTTLIGDLYNI